MKKSPYLQINRIEFMTTFHCPGRCKHCSVGERINEPGAHHVPLEESVEAVRWLAGNYPVESMMTFGGEPLLYPELVCALHKTAADCGVPRRQLITNGYFSKRPERIRQVAEALAASGVNDALLSVDVFHQETIPLEPVLYFAQCFMECAPGSLQLQPSWVVNEAHEDPWNAKTRQILARFAPLGVPVGRGDGIFLAGNAVENLAQYYPAPHLDLEETCGSMPYTEPLDRITSLSIEPSGDVVACAYPIGNLRRESMEAIAARYDPYADPCAKALLDSGAKGLLELAERSGVEVDLTRCWSVCDLCRQVKIRGSRQKDVKLW